MKDNILEFETGKENSMAAFESLKKEYKEVQMSEEQLRNLEIVMQQAKKENREERGRRHTMRYVTAAAAVMLAFLILPNTSATAAYAMEKIPVIGQLVKVVTFRDYEYEDDRNSASVDIPKLEVEQTDGEKALQKELEKTTDEINAEIEEISMKLVEEFKESMENEMGYQDLIVQSEVLATTQDYFTLKLLCYQGAGSGYQFNYYYTIDLNTGERLQLQDIFKEGADYITPISENIKEQMRAQMSADENVQYWLDNEVEEWNFKAITDETSFYLNEKGNVVIGFNEGDVAPMYMGTVEFEIPAEVLKDIRK